MIILDVLLSYRGTSAVILCEESVTLATILTTAALTLQFLQALSSKPKIFDTGGSCFDSTRNSTQTVLLIFNIDHKHPKLS